MVQLLAALLEWLAIGALSLAGVSYDAPEPCPVQETTATYSAIYMNADMLSDPLARTPSLREFDVPQLGKRNERVNCTTRDAAADFIHPIMVRERTSYDS